ncbi:MAG: HD domain-containing protein [Deltaproteobacteria bacterium]|nr:HD domain-containing protein [Deltaproteobacteria bacterium]
MKSKINLGELILADDDPNILDLLSKTLSHSFSVRMAKNGTEALSLLKKCHPVAVLTDEMMPGASGTDVLEACKKAHPAAVRMLMTAASDFTAAVNAVNRGELHRFFPKPVRPVQLRKNVVEVVERAQREHLLHSEIETLSGLADEKERQEVRVLILGLDDAAAEDMENAAQRRGYQTTVASVDKERAAVQQLQDMVILAEPDPSRLKHFVHMLRSIDETMAVVVVDKNSQLENAVYAHELGVADFITYPFPDDEALARRLERAVHPRIVGRELRHLTSHLIESNRELAEARKTIERDQVKLVNAIVRTLEARDAYTAGHTDRVAAIAVRLGQQLGFDSETQERIRIGALLHDVGKIGVRDDVLLKPGRLSPEEFERIQVHTVLGHELLSEIEQFECILPMVRNHHEKLDGSGYPDGLVGDEIPIEVRIVSIADVFDAVTSTRPYRASSSIDVAFGILDSLAAHHLDPAIIASLKSLHAEDRLHDLVQDPTDAN